MISEHHHSVCVAIIIEHHYPVHHVCHEWSSFLCEPVAACRSMREFVEVIGGSQQYLQRKLERHKQTVVS
jgi:predicted metal-binding transcription factor (methanogenesis marker protein 9)